IASDAPAQVREIAAADCPQSCPWGWLSLGRLTLSRAGSRDCAPARAIARCPRASANVGESPPAATVASARDCARALEACALQTAAAITRRSRMRRLQTITMVLGATALLAAAG